MAPWEKYGGAPAPTAPQAPGVIMGRPKAPDPYRVDQDRINNSQEAERLAMAREKDRRDAEKDRLDIEKRQREATAGPAAAAAEGERKASGFLKRALNAENSYLNIENSPGPRSMVGQFMADAAPNLLNSLPADIGNSPERQSADQSQREFIAAVLRYDSGAAIPPEEFVTNARIYYPQPGDSPQVIEQKAQSRRVAIEGLRDSSGIMAPQSVAEPETAASVAQWASRVVAPGGGDDSAARAAGQQAGKDYRPEQDEIALAMDLPGTQTSDITGGRLPPQQEAALAAYLKARSGDASFNPAEYQAFAKSLGVEGYLALAPELVEAVRKGEALPTGIDYSQADDAARARAEAELQKRLGGEEIGINSQIDKGISLNLSDEIYGLSGGLGELLTGGSFADGYARERDVERAAQRAGRDKYGIAPEIASGFLAPAGVLGQAKNVGQFVRQGAAIGGLAGFGEGEGSVNSLLNAGVGTAAGGALGGTISQAPKAINALMNTGAGQKFAGAVRRNPGNIDREVVEAGQRQNIPIRQPDARPETRNAFAVVEASPTQGEKVRKTLDADKTAVRARLDQVAGDGNRVDNFTMGETVQGAGQRYIAKSREQANALYKRAETASEGTKVKPEQALQAIDDNIAELTAAGPKGNAGAIKYLEDLRSDLGRGELSIEQLRSIRTNMRGQISERNLTATDAERRVGDVLRAASADIERGLSSNPQALGAYKAADAFYQEKQTFIKDVVQRFTGSRNSPLSAEQAASKFQAMMRNKGDYKRFSEMTKRLEPEERADMAASIAESLGTARNGEFTLAGLATNIEKLNPRALRDLFGEDGAKAIADLRVIARAKADTANGLNNSKSGVVMAANNQFKDVLLGAVGGGIGGIPGAMGGMAARGGVERLSSARAARLLLNPDFTKWLRQTPSSTSPAVINRHFDRLNKIASREQVFLMDAKALQDFLRGSVSEGVGRAAATGDERQDNGRK